MHQHALDTILERHRARVARPAGAAQLELDDAVLEAAEVDVAAVLLDGGPDARLEQLLDHADHLGVVLVVRERIDLVGRLHAARVLGSLFALDHVDERLAGRDGLGDEREHLGADVRPVGVGVLGHGDEVGAVEDGVDAVDVHKLRGEGRRVRGRNGRAWVEVLDEGRRDGRGQDPVVRQELERVRVGGVLGLDEDVAAAAHGGGAGQDVVVTP